MFFNSRNDFVGQRDNASRVGCVVEAYIFGGQDRHYILIQTPDNTRHRATSAISGNNMNTPQETKNDDLVEIII